MPRCGTANLWSRARSLAARPDKHRTELPHGRRWGWLMPIMLCFGNFWADYAQVDPTGCASADFFHETHVFPWFRTLWVVRKFLCSMIWKSVFTMLDFPEFRVAYAHIGGRKRLGML